MDPVRPGGIGHVTAVKTICKSTSFFSKGGGNCDPLLQIRNCYCNFEPSIPLLQLRDCYCNFEPSLKMHINSFIFICAEIFLTFFSKLIVSCNLSVEISYSFISFAIFEFLTKQ